MPDNKRQHYVPKFYLRLFGYNDGASLDVYNIRRGRIFRGASLKTQAYRDWFYGKELAFEKFFQFFEGKAGNIIKSIVNTRRLPRRFSQEHHMLMMHVALQMARTEAAEAILNEKADKIARMLIGHCSRDPEVLEALPRVKISLTNAIQDSIRHSIATAPLLFDLRYKLIENTSSTPFIVSDAPVILYNDWLRDVQRNTGSASFGLQVIMPLGPRLCLIFYDEGSYEVGKPTSNLVRIVNPTHACMLNDLQWEAAHANIYASPETTDQDLAEGAARADNLRKTEKVDVAESWSDISETRKRMLLSVENWPSKVELQLPFVRRRLPRLASLDAFEVPPVRNGIIVDFVMEAARCMEEGLISIPSFLAQSSVYIADLVRPGRQKMK